MKKSLLPFRLEGLLWGVLPLFFCGGCGESKAQSGHVPHPEKGRVEKWHWQVEGPGGGGCYRAPAISPHQSDLVLCASNMGAIFRSENFGRNWEIVLPEQYRAPITSSDRPHHVFAFHPTDGRRVLAGSDFGLFDSRDEGRTWTQIKGPWSDWTGVLRQSYGTGPRLVSFDSSCKGWIAAVFDPTIRTRVGAKIFISKDDGHSWEAGTDLPENSGQVINLVVDPGHGSIFVATKNGIYHGDAEGKIWRRIHLAGGDPGELTVLDFVGAGSKGTFFLYASVSFSGEEDAQNALYVSRDGGGSWQKAGVAGIPLRTEETPVLSFLAVSAGRPDVIYASRTGVKTNDPKNPEASNIYRSGDAGSSWHPVFFAHPENKYYNVRNTSWLTGKWGWAQGWYGMVICDSDANRVGLTTITGVYLSKNGGQDWYQVHAPDGSADRQPGGGIPVMTIWDYYTDPHNKQRRYLASTDFSGWRSLDAGVTWQIADKGNPWFQNTYVLVFDPEVPGKIWNGGSRTHDLPFWRNQQGLGTFLGGISLSVDAGLTWKALPSGNSLPNAAVLGLWLDRKSAVNARHLWAAIPGKGLYLSENGGETWAQRNQGLDPENLNLIRIQGDDEGVLYALSTIRVRGKRRDGGALYQSRDHGKTWKKVWSADSARFVTDLTVDPGDPKTLYVSALQEIAALTSTDGGVWMSRDQGGSWKKIFEAPCYALTVDPKNSNRLFASFWAGMGGGLSLSTDHGTTWTSLDNYPFWRPLKVSFDAGDPDTIHVTNFGGGIFQGKRAALPK